MGWHDNRRDRSGFSAGGGAGHPGAAPAPTVLAHGKVLAHGRIVAHGRIMRAAAALAITALAGGCFQPLYGEQSPTGGPVLRDQLSAVDILQIEAPKGTDDARMAVEIRNALLYDFTGGGYAAPPTHRLKVAMSSTRASIIVNVQTSRPDVENYGINATYSLFGFPSERNKSRVVCEKRAELCAAC